MIPCIKCSARSRVIEVERCRNGTIRRRHKCRSCSHRWTTYEGEKPGHEGGVPVGFVFKCLTPAEVREVLLMQGSIRSIAKRTGRSSACIRAVLIGASFRDLHPDLPRRSTSTLSCYQCANWSGGRCQMGFPDPIEEGPGFAAECSSYIASE